MRALIIATSVILFSQLLFAQQKTEAYFGLSGRMDFSTDVIELYDKGYYIAGGFVDDYNKSWNLKTDRNIELVYDNIFEHSLGDVSVSCVVSDDNGNIFISGYTVVVDQWPFVAKIDSCGNKVWCKILSYEDDYENGSALDIRFYC